MLCVVAGLVGWLVLTEPPAALGWQVVLWAVVLGALMLALRVGRENGGGLQLRDGAIFTDGGEMLVRVEDIRKIDQGVFAIKPSNGFLLRLKTPQARGWVPGLWWRFGRLMGVGGVTSKVQAQLMAETLSALIARQV